MGAKRRDRHGRGLRGPLAPPEVPISRTRSEKFDDLVRDEVQRIADKWLEELDGVEFAVEEVPPTDSTGQVPLSRQIPGGPGRSPRIVLFRRPLEARRGDGDENLTNLIREVVVDEIAALLGLPPEVVDPD